jgi:predicted CoA-binding protein
MENLIKDFMALKKFAIIGATDNKKKYGHQILVNLKNRGYKVYPINPRLSEIEGVKCYSSLRELPEKVDVVDFVVPPQVTETVLRECRELGLSRIWLQPGSESEAAVEFCRENDLQVVHSVCVMMN